MKSGIYQIQSLVHPDRLYIGSAKDLKLRIRTHKHRLNKGNHANYLLQAHCLKYGINDLIFSIVEHCPIECLLKREQFYIDQLAPSFNICKIAGNTIGRPQSEETRRKRSEAMKGKMKGVFATPEVRKAMSAGQQRRHAMPTELNHFLLLHEDTAQVHGGKRRHIFMCGVCGGIKRLTSMQARAGACPCRSVFKVKIVRPLIVGPKHVYTYYKARKDSSTGIVGVMHESSGSKPYRARIKLNGKWINVGYYSTLEEADSARQDKIRLLDIPNRRGSISYTLPITHTDRQ